METLPISKENVLKAHEAAGTQGKTLLEDLFGAKTFQKKITDRVKTFEDALAVIGMTQTEFNEAYGKAPQSQAFGKLEVIAKALNEGWKPNWNDDDEYKYYAWFDMEDGFSFDCVDYVYLDSCVGSRLCFRSSELAEYAGKQFLEIYKVFMVL